MGTHNALHLYNNMLQLIPNPNETTVSNMLLNIKLLIVKLFFIVFLVT